MDVILGFLFRVRRPVRKAGVSGVLGRQSIEMCLGAARADIVCKLLHTLENLFKKLQFCVGERHIDVTALQPNYDYF